MEEEKEREKEKRYWFQEKTTTTSSLRTQVRKLQTEVAQKDGRLEQMEKLIQVLAKGEQVTPSKFSMSLPFIHSLLTDWTCRRVVADADRRCYWDQIASVSYRLWNKSRSRPPYSSQHPYDKVEEYYRHRQD